MRGHLGGDETAPCLSPAGEPGGLAQVWTGKLGRETFAKHIFVNLDS